MVAGGEDARVPVAAFGEIGLTGELRSVAHHDRRSEEAKKFGLTQLVTPETAPDTAGGGAARVRVRAEPVQARRLTHRQTLKLW